MKSGGDLGLHRARQPDERPAAADGSVETIVLGMTQHNGFHMKEVSERHGGSGLHRAARQQISGQPRGRNRSNDRARNDMA
jgi:hypothetical protein